MPAPSEHQMLEHCLSMMPEHCLSNALRTYGRNLRTTTYLADSSHLAYRAQGGSKK